MATQEILLVGRFSRLLSSFAQLLQAQGYGVNLASGIAAAVGVLPKKSFDLLIVLVSQTQKENLSLIKIAKHLDGNMKTMILGESNGVLPLEAYGLPVDDFLLLPSTPRSLAQRVARCLESPSLEERSSRAAAVNQRVFESWRSRLHQVQTELGALSDSLKEVHQEHLGQAAMPAAAHLEGLAAELARLRDLTAGFFPEAAGIGAAREWAQQIVDITLAPPPPLEQEVRPCSAGEGPSGLPQKAPNQVRDIPGDATGSNARYNTGENLSKRVNFTPDRLLKMQSTAGVVH